MKFDGVDAEIARLFEGVKKLEADAIREVQRATMVVAQEMMDRTPVWEGTVVRNFAAAVGTSPSGSEKSAIGSGDPGPTNSMALGSEPRRPANEAAARAEIAQSVAGMRALKDVFIGNTSNDFDKADSGALPTPQRSRNPGGIVRPAQSAARGKLGGNWR